MASGFIAIAIAHDYTCPKGEEWVFHGIPKSDGESMSDKKEKKGEEDSFWKWIIVAAISLIIGGIAIGGIVVFFILRS